MSVAGAPVADPISLASAAGRALPRRVLALIADTIVISLLDAILTGTLVVPLGVVTYPPLPSVVRRRRVIGLAAVTAVLLVLCGTFAYFGRPPLVIEGAKNTSQGIFTDGVSSYTLGSPRWGTGTVTY